jgi:hypothetical protein
VAYVSGMPAGSFELERQPDAVVELAPCGRLPRFIGQGLGAPGSPPPPPGPRRWEPGACGSIPAPWAIRTPSRMTKPAAVGSCGWRSGSKRGHTNRYRRVQARLSPSKTVRPRTPNEEAIMLGVGDLRSAAFPSKVKDVGSKLAKISLTPVRYR